MSSKRLAPVLAVVGGALVLVLALVIGNQLGGDSNEPKPTNIRAGSVNPMLQGIPQRGIAIGDPTAKVTIIEFADPQCPGCGEWARNVFPTIVQEFIRTGKLRMEFRGLRFIDTFPGGSDESERLLKFALAAGQQNKLWHVIELEFENQGGENSNYVTDSFLRAIGEEAAGLDAAKALAEWNTPEVEAMVKESEKLAEARLPRVQTPSFLIGRTGTEITELVNDPSVEGLAEVIDAELAK